MKIASKVFLLLPIAFSCFSGEPTFVYGKDSIVSFPEKSVADFNPRRDGERLVLILNGDSGEKASLLSNTVRVSGLEGGGGLITTKTGAQSWEEIDPLSERGENASAAELMNKTLRGDNLQRCGILEIRSDSGSAKPLVCAYGGDIADNYSASDSRGRVGLVLDSPNLSQTISGENSYSGDTKLLSGTLRMNVSSYKGRIVLRGGTLEIISENPKLYNLDWGSGGFKIDLKKHAPITLAGSANVSALPQAADAFDFENVSEGEFCIFKYSKNISPSFSNFSGQIIDCASNGKIYAGTFNADESSLKIVFKKK